MKGEPLAPIKAAIGMKVADALIWCIELWLRWPAVKAVFHGHAVLYGLRTRGPVDIIGPARIVVVDCQFDGSPTGQSRAAVKQSAGFGVPRSKMAGVPSPSM